MAGQYITVEGVAALLSPSSSRIRNESVWMGDLSCFSERSILTDNTSCGQQTNLTGENVIIADVTTLEHYAYDYNESDVPKVTDEVLHRLTAPGESVC